MRDKELDAAQMAIKRKRILEESFRLFSENGIESITMPDIAKASEVGRATIFRYFGSKLDLVVEVGARAWKRYNNDYKKRLDEAGFDSMSALEEYEFFLDSFLDLYRNHRELLCFNQYFNIYVKGAEATPEQLEPYMKMLSAVINWFHSIYSKAESDGTLRTDVTETEMFASTLHLMLAAVTRYAVGLVYVPDEETDAEQELIMLKEMLLDRYMAK